MDITDIREFLEGNLFETPEWFRGFAQGLILAEAIDQHEAERLEDYWNDLRGEEGVVTDEDEEEGY